MAELEIDRRESEIEIIWQERTQVAVRFTQNGQSRTLMVPKSYGPEEISAASPFYFSRRGEVVIRQIEPNKRWIVRSIYRRKDRKEELPFIHQVNEALSTTKARTPLGSARARRIGITDGNKGDRFILNVTTEDGVIEVDGMAEIVNANVLAFQASGSCSVYFNDILIETRRAGEFHKDSFTRAEIRDYVAAGKLSHPMTMRYEFLEDGSRFYCVHYPGEDVKRQTFTKRSGWEAILPARKRDAFVFFPTGRWQLNGSDVPQEFGAQLRPKVAPSIRCIEDGTAIILSKPDIDLE